jgi:hypothetical protein
MKSTIFATLLFILTNISFGQFEPPSPEANLSLDHSTSVLINPGSSSSPTFYIHHPDQPLSVIVQGPSFAGYYLGVMPAPANFNGMQFNGGVLSMFPCISIMIGYDNLVGPICPLCGVDVTVFDVSFLPFNFDLTIQAVLISSQLPFGYKLTNPVQIMTPVSPNA